MRGRYRGYVERDYKSYPEFGSYREFSGGYIPRSEWIGRIEHLNEIKGQPVHWHKAKCQIKQQARTNYCWCYGTVSGIETAYAMSGISDIELNAHAVAFRGKRGANKGGFGLEACHYVQDYGIPETQVLAEFTKTVRWSDPVQQNASQHKLYEFEELPRNDSFEAVASALLGDKPCSCTVAFSWWRHLVLAVGVAVRRRNQFGLIIANSWGKNWSLGGEVGGYGIIWDERGKADPFEAIAIRGVKARKE